MVNNDVFGQTEASFRRQTTVSSLNTELRFDAVAVVSVAGQNKRCKTLSDLRFCFLVFCRLQQFS